MLTKSGKHKTQMQDMLKKSQQEQTQRNEGGQKKQKVTAQEGTKS